MYAGSVVYTLPGYSSLQVTQLVEAIYTAIVSSILNVQIITPSLYNTTHGKILVNLMDLPSKILPVLVIM